MSVMCVRVRSLLSEVCGMHSGFWVLLFLYIDLLHRQVARWGWKVLEQSVQRRQEQQDFGFDLAKLETQVCSEKIAGRTLLSKKTTGMIEAGTLQCYNVAGVYCSLYLNRF